jgi:hypothetical protein
MDPSIATLFLSITIGLACTGIFARVLYLGWPTWQKVFETQDHLHRHESYANEAGILTGILIFVMSALFAGAFIRRLRMK